MEGRIRRGVGICNFRKTDAIHWRNFPLRALGLELRNSLSFRLRKSFCQGLNKLNIQIVSLDRSDAAKSRRRASQIPPCKEMDDPNLSFDSHIWGETTHRRPAGGHGQGRPGHRLRAGGFRLRGHPRCRAADHRARRRPGQLGLQCACRHLGHRRRHPPGERQRCGDSYGHPHRRRRLGTRVAHRLRRSPGADRPPGSPRPHRSHGRP